MNSPGIRYRPLPDAPPEAEAEVLAAVYLFLIECHEKRKNAKSSDDKREEVITTASQEPHRG